MGLKDRAADVLEQDDGEGVDHATQAHTCIITGRCFVKGLKEQVDEVLQRVLIHRINTSQVRNGEIEDRRADSHRHKLEP
jgi:hypothetical protein